MYGSKPSNLQAQRGVSLIGLIISLAVIFSIALLAMQVFPTFMEYRSIKAGIESAKRQGGSLADMRLAFDKAADINAITTITAKDLIVSKNNGDLELAFDYEKRIPLITNVFLVIHYAGTTDKSGVIPDKPDPSAQ
jgi:hypothetical protein